MEAKLKELVWKLDREVWAHVPGTGNVDEFSWSTSKAREVSAELIAEYFGSIPEWKSVNKLPKTKPKENAITPFFHSDWVIVMCGNNERPIVSRYEHGQINGNKWAQWYDQETGYHLENVHHWMELPIFKPNKD